MTPRRRVLLALSDTGFGHRAAANAVAAALDDLVGDRVRTTLVDVYSELEVPLLAAAPDLYGMASRHGRPAYDLLFRLSGRAAPGLVLTRGVRTLARRRVEDLLVAQRPDAVVVFNPFFMGDLLAAVRRRGGPGFALATVVTDPVSVHASWFCPGVDLHFLVGHPGPRPRGLACRPVGFPVHPGFARPLPDRATARERLGLDPGRPVALLTGGGSGGGSRRTWRVLLHALAGAGDVQLLVAAGANAGVLALLRRSEFAEVTLLAATGSLEAALRASSMAFSKAGPATIFEAGCLGVPLRLFDEVGRQERGNTAYAAALGLAAPLGDDDPVALVREAEHRPRTPRPDLADGAGTVARWVAAQVGLGPAGPQPAAGSSSLEA